jgi:hypothetical protein
MLLASAEPPITLFAVGVGALLFGAFFLRDGLRWLSESLERQRGPSVPGRIISSQLVDRDSADPDQSRTWYLHVVYEYTVDGRLYCGTRITPGRTWFNSWWHAMWQARKYELGAEVRVYFDLAEPDRAILDPRLTVCSLWFSLLAGVSCLVAGVVALRS